MRYLTTQGMAFALCLASALPALAGGNHGGHTHESVSDLPKAGVDSSVGEITRIDKEKRRVFIKHGDMRKIGMLAMLMVFDIREAEILDRVKIGDKVRFSAERDGSRLTVIELQVIE